MSRTDALPRPPYAESDDPRTMRGDCRVTAVRLGLPDPRDRHLLVHRTAPGLVEPPVEAPVARGADAEAAGVAARLGL